MQKNCSGWTLVRICIENVSCKTHFACIFALHHLFFQFVAKMCSPPKVGSTFLKNAFEHLRSKISLFWPPNAFYESHFCNFRSLLSLRCSFASLCVRSLSPPKTACGCSRVRFSPPSPVCKNDRLQKDCNVSNVVCDLLFSLWFSCFTIPFLSNFCHFLWNLLPAFGGKHISERHM